VKSVRLDTASGTSYSDVGRDTTVVRNVFFGLDAMTIKGEEHTIRNNTGDELNIVRAWGAISANPDGSGGMNQHTVTENNAVTSIESRCAGCSFEAGWDAPESQHPGNFLPGTASGNACNNRDHMTAAGSPECTPLPSGGVCAALRSCSLDLLRTQLIQDYSGFDFRPTPTSGLHAGAYQENDAHEIPGVRAPHAVFPVPTTPMTTTTTTTRTAAMSTTTSTASPNPCLRFCEMRNLKLENKVCRNVKNESDCERSFMWKTDDGSQPRAKPCRWKGQRCKSNREAFVTCPNLPDLCSP